jgi:hypothetical protein
MTAPALGLPVQDKFQLYVYKKGGLDLHVATQFWGITPQPVGYLRKELDQGAKEWPGCLRAKSTVSFLVPEAEKHILNCPLKENFGYLTGVYFNIRPRFWEGQK